MVNSNGNMGSGQFYIFESNTRGSSGKNSNFGCFSVFIVILILIGVIGVIAENGILASVLGILFIFVILYYIYVFIIFLDWLFKKKNLTKDEKKDINKRWPNFNCYKIKFFTILIYLIIFSSITGFFILTNGRDAEYGIIPLVFIFIPFIFLKKLEKILEREVDYMDTARRKSIYESNKNKEEMNGNDF